MLFLLNDEVLDIGDPVTRIGSFQDLLAGRDPFRMTRRQVVALGQQAYFQTPAGERPPRRIREMLAHLAVLRIEADAALFVRPANAARPADVAWRFVTAPITVLSHLHRMQVLGPLGADYVNDAVWRHAA